MPWLTATAQARSLTDVHRVTVDSGGMVRMKDVVAVLNRYLDRTSGPVTAHPDAREKVTGPVGKHVVRRWNMTFKTVGVSFEVTGPFLVITVESTNSRGRESKWSYVTLFDGIFRPVVGIDGADRRPQQRISRYE